MIDRIKKDLSLTNSDIRGFLLDAILGINNNELPAKKGITAAYMIVDKLLNKYAGDMYFITYRLNSRDGLNPYLCTDRDDLLRCLKIEQEGKCEIETINGINWDKDDYSYYVSEAR